MLLGTDQWLEALVNNPTFTTSLPTPDGIRKVLEEQAKFAALAGEVAALRQAVATERLPAPKVTHVRDRSQIAPGECDDTGLGARPRDDQPTPVHTSVDGAISDYNRGAGDPVSTGALGTIPQPARSV